MLCKCEKKFLGELYIGMKLTKGREKDEKS